MTLKVNLGCGSDIRKGWMNVDIFPNPNLRNVIPSGGGPDFNVKEIPNYFQWDLSTGLPKSLKDVTIFSSSHFFEHLTINQGIPLMTHCYNKLLPGGVFYAEIPDFVSTLKAYLSKDWKYFNHPAILHFTPNRILAEIVDYALHQRVNDKPEHVSFLDSELFIHMLKTAGFSNVFQCEFDEELGNPDPLRRKYSIYFKAIK